MYVTKGCFFRSQNNLGDYLLVGVLHRVFFKRLKLESLKNVFVLVLIGDVALQVRIVTFRDKFF